MILKDLDNGDIFVHANSLSKNPTKYIVYGNPKFNRGHGSSTRMCRKMDGELISKSCRLEVYKVGESKHKIKIQEFFTPKINK